MVQNMPISRYPEIWGGIECTIARIGDRYHDQLEASGHYQRGGDIARLSDLGIKAIRYPLLWERHQPVRDRPVDWTWTDHQLQLLRKENITPIAGLLHHGSGPAFTDLSKPGFADELAAYAGLVAARYPWIDYYTPVNEPLTTARFSGLYGIWYPHKRDARSCINMLLNQVKGIVYSMQAIRRINPAAQLVQTEDLGYTHSSPALAYQADFENCRRWLSFDLLCGKVDSEHPLWSYLMAIGLDAADLAFFTSNPCPPDILGINYYVTSERYLDDEINKYPIDAHGGNGRHVYADVAAVRVEAPIGLLALIEQAWRRYRLPMAITETHLDCTREQQLRWLKETWAAACEALRRNIDVRAVTPWAMIGAFDWDSLLTANNGNYESGAYRIKDGALKLTAVGVMIRSLAAIGAYHHPLLNSPGWWHSHEERAYIQKNHASPLLVVGSPENNNQWVTLCHDRGIVCRFLVSSPLEASFKDWQEVLTRYGPWAVILNIEEEACGFSSLSTACKLQRLPVLLWRDHSGRDVETLQHALDVLIDVATIHPQPAMTDQLYSI